MILCRIFVLFIGIQPLSLFASGSLESQILSGNEQNTAEIVLVIKNLTDDEISSLSDEAIIKASYISATSIEIPMTLKLTEVLLNRAQQKNAPSLAGQAYYNRGAVYAYSGRHDLALDAFLRSLTNFESANNENDIAQIKGGLALMYIELGEYNLAEPYLNEAIAYYRQIADEARLSRSLQNRGFMSIKLREYTSGKQDLIEALAISTRLNLNNNFPVLYKNLGKIEIELENFNKANGYLAKALESATANHLNHTQSEIYREYARLALKEGNPQIAKDAILTSIRLGETHNLLKQLKESYLVLSLIEANNRQFEAAYLSKLKSEEYAAEMGDSRIAQNLLRLDRYTSELIERNERLLLEKENKIAVLAAEREQLLKNLSIAVAIIAILLSIYFIRRFSYSNKQAEKFEQQSKIDSLTGIWNRRAGEAKLNRLCARGQTEVKVFSIAMLDIDYFKRVNDKFGHDVGDKVIITICRLIEQSMRPTDMLCRWGGEEFVLILESFDSKRALDICERIRKNIAETEIDPIGHLTVSIGISMFENDELFELLKRGDQALYHAKHLGRNRVVIKNKPAQINTSSEEFVTVE